MTVTLRPYQQEAVEAVYRHLRERDDNPVCVIPTGGGKTWVIATICRDAVTRWRGRVLVLAHVRELLEQNAEKIRALCPDIEVGIYSAGLNSRDTDTPVLVAGIQSVYRRAHELGPFDLVLVDEVHRVPADGEGSYRSFLRDALEINPNLRIIGLTATPFRLQGGLICQPENLLNHICFEIGLREMIVQGYLSPLRSRAGKSKAELDNLHVRGGEFVAGEVEAAMDQDELVQSACREIVQLTRDRKSVLIFAASVAHCEHIAEQIRRISGHECGIITGDTPSAERAETIARFKGEPVPDTLFEPKPRLKYLANVNVLTTGFDATNVDCVVLLRPTNSPGLLVQMCLDMDTEVLTPAGWRRCHDITTGDMVAAFDLESHEITYTPAVDKVHRPLRSDESIYGVAAPHVDIRVTNKHNMVVRCKNRRITRWRLETAENAAGRRETYVIPVAGAGASYSTDASISDAEVEFLGWFLTDGCLSTGNGGVQFSQSVTKYPDRIRDMLERGGFGFREYTHSYPGELSRYADSVRFYVPKGGPRGDNSGMRGWGGLEAWLDKDIPAIYNTLSKRQFRLLISAMDLANGRHPETIDYRKNTKDISCGCRQRLAERVQQLAIERGFRCNVASFVPKPSSWNGTPQRQWMLHIREQQVAYIGGCSAQPNPLIPRRCSVKPLAHEPNEWVWCLTTSFHTLVTRRNGKVAILGNCGRGTRLHPGKQDCLILDYGGNIMRHGPVDAIEIREASNQGKGKAPAKECPECSALVHAAYQICPECGAEFPPPDRQLHEAQADGSAILSGEITDTDYEVLGTYYSVHTKRGADDDAPKTMRIEYRVHWQQYISEWVCPEHSGWARQKFVQWWTQRSQMPPPTSAAEAVRLAEDGALAETRKITVRTVSGERFDRVIAYELGPMPEYCPEPGWNDGIDEDPDLAPAVAWDGDDELPF